jgi:NAD(P)-dependent dehydrogenase (short-subunit alcohol dehydrogenase family)
MATDMVAAWKDGWPPVLMDVHAIRRIATVKEVVAGILFLAGPSVGYITSSVLDVGGYLV